MVLICDTAAGADELSSRQEEQHAGGLPVLTWEVSCRD